MAAVGLLAVEVFIALKGGHGFVRAYGGDFLATIWLYCLARGAGARPVPRVAVSVLGVAYLLELLQYGQVLERLGWQHSRLLRTVLGSRFAWGDLAAYTLGILLVLLVERCRRGTRPE